MSRPKPTEPPLPISLSTPVSELGLSNTVENRLRGARIDTVGDLVQKTEEEMLAIRRIGAWVLEKVKARLEGTGFSLKESPPKYVDPADWRRRKKSDATKARMSAAQQARYARAMARAREAINQRALGH